MAGLTWTRQPGMRVLFHPNRQGNVRLLGRAARPIHRWFRGRRHRRAACRSSGSQGTQLDAGLNLGACTNNTANYRYRDQLLLLRARLSGQPTVTPDFIAKLAFDPTSRFHFEVTGLNSNFKTTNAVAPVHTALHQVRRRRSGRRQRRSRKEHPRDLDQLLERWRRPVSVRPGARSDCPRGRLPQPAFTPAAPSTASKRR